MRKILITLLLLMPIQMLGQLGRNALPGDLEIFTVYESKSPSLTKILEYVTNSKPQYLTDGIDFLKKVRGFEQNIFQNFEIEIIRSDSVIAIVNKSGFGKMNMSSKIIRSKYVINVNGAHFFFLFKKGKRNQICDEFIDEFLRPTNETYGCLRIHKPGFFDDISERFDILITLVLYMILRHGYARGTKTANGKSHTSLYHGSVNGQYLKKLRHQTFSYHFLL